MGTDIYLYGKGPLKTQETYEEANIQFSNTNFPERALIKLWYSNVTWWHFSLVALTFPVQYDPDCKVFFH